MIAAAPHTSTTPKPAGSTSVATRMTASSDSASVSPGRRALANTPVESIRVSTTIVPTIQPPTASCAARPSRAEKNFWYMFASPSSKNIVGRKSASAACGPRAPNSDTWPGGSAASAAPGPPAPPTMNATASSTPNVISRPLPTSR